MRNLRKHGPKPYKIAVVHVGPGAAGEMRPVAEELSKDSGILEPRQTAKTVEGQVRELREVSVKDGTLPVKTQSEFYRILKEECASEERFEKA